jgi:hypothetical protein
MAAPPFPTLTRNPPPNTFAGGVVFILIGVVWLVILYNFFIAPDWRLHHDYVECRCVVLDKRLGQQGDEDDATWRPEIHVRYTVDGQQHEVWTYDFDGAYNSDQGAQQRALAAFTVGQEYALWYDPSNPDRAVLVRNDHPGSYWIAVIPLGCVMLGVLAIVAALRGPPADPAASPRDVARALAAIPGLADMAAHLGRVGALEQAAASQTTDPTSPGVAAWPALPTVPDPIFHEQPGAVLPVSLRPGMPQPVAYMMAMALLALGGALALSALFTLQSPGFITGIMLAIAAVLLYFGGRSWLIQTRVGPTGVELSSHPIRPGEPFELLLNQAGPLRLRRLWVQLICEEEVSYRQGTDTRTEKKCVWRQVVFDAADLEVARDASLAWRGQAELSAGAMHSFRAPHNGVRWKVLVHGEPAGLPKYERDFPVVVAPPQGASLPNGIAAP